jgi:hypothetical protein
LPSLLKTPRKKKRCISTSIGETYALLVYSLAVVTTELTEGREIIIWLGSAGGDLDWECTR